MATAKKKKKAAPKRAGKKSTKKKSIGKKTKAKKKTAKKKTVKKKTAKKKTTKKATKKKKAVAKKSAKKKSSKKKVTKKAVKKGTKKKSISKKKVAKKKTKPAKKSGKAGSKAVAKRAFSRDLEGLFTPLDDRLIVQAESVSNQTSGGIIIPDSASTERPTRGKVLAVGRGHLNSKGKIKPMDVKAGDAILYSAYTGNSIFMGETEVLVMRESDVLGIIGS